MSTFFTTLPHRQAPKPPTEYFTIHEDTDCILDPQRGMDAFFYRLHGFRRQELAAFHKSGVHKALSTYDLTHGHWSLNDPSPRRMNQARSVNWDNSERGENRVPRDAIDQGWTVGWWVSRLDEYERDGVFDWVGYRSNGILNIESQGNDAADQLEEDDTGEDADDEVDFEDEADQINEVDEEEQDSYDETVASSDEEVITMSGRIARLFNGLEEFRLSYFTPRNTGS